MTTHTQKAHLEAK